MKNQSMENAQVQAQGTENIQVRLAGKNHRAVNCRDHTLQMLLKIALLRGVAESKQFPTGTS